MAYTPEQKQMIALAKRLSARDNPKVRQALLAAMAVESNFRNVNYGDRDSLGVLQQRPSQGWGPPGNPAQDIQQFLARARNLRGFRGTPGQLAQAIQRSAFPARYDQRMNQVHELLGGGLGGESIPVANTQPLQGASRGASTGRLSALRGALGQGPLALVRALQAATPAETPLGAPVSPSQPLPGPGRFSVEELFHDPLGGFKHGRPTGAIGGHGKHVHVAEDDPAQMLAIIQLAKRLGLRVGENPWVDPVDPVHTKNSYHYRGTPFRGRRMGRAADVSGSPAAMRQFYLALAPKRR